MEERTSKSGFSQSFACCSHWKECDYGRKNCFYEEKDPLAMKSCRSYQRNNGKERTEIPLKVVENVIPKVRNVSEPEQLSLF